MAIRKLLVIVGAAACARPRTAAPIIANDDDPPVVVPVGPFPSLDAYCDAIHDCSPVDLHAARARVGPFDAVVPMQLADPYVSRCVVGLERRGRWFVAPPDGHVCAEDEETRTRHVRVVALDREIVEIDFDVEGIDDQRADPGYRLTLVCAARADALACTPLFSSRRSHVSIQDGIVTVTSRGEPSEGDGVYRLFDAQTPNPIPISPEIDRGALPITP